AALENADTITIGVTQDRAGVRTSINEFVDAYNKLMDTVDSLTSVVSVGGDDGEPLAAALVGDASVRSFLSAICCAVGVAAGGGRWRRHPDSCRPGRDHPA